MGGTLSEGINFKDDLARCIIVVGQPYPSMDDMALKVKMDYFGSEDFKNKCISTQNPDLKDCVENGEKISNCNSSSSFSPKDYYESICVKKVN